MPLDPLDRLIHAIVTTRNGVPIQDSEFRVNLLRSMMNAGIRVVETHVPQPGYYVMMWRYYTGEPQGRLWFVGPFRTEIEFSEYVGSEKRRRDGFRLDDNPCWQQVWLDDPQQVLVVSPGDYAKPVVAASLELPGHSRAEERAHARRMTAQIREQLRP